MPGWNGEAAGAVMTVPLRSLQGIATRSGSMTEGKFFAQRSSPEHGEVAWTFIKCSEVFGFAGSRGRVVRIRFVELMSGWKTARVVSGIIIGDIVVVVESNLVWIW